MKQLLALFLFTSIIYSINAQPVIHLNQVAFDSGGPKMAVISSKIPLPALADFTITDTLTKKTILTAELSRPQKNTDWAPDQVYYQADFSLVQQAGTYVLSLTANGQTVKSYPFQVGPDVLAKLTIPAIVHYYHNQRATTPQELEVDKHLQLFGSTERVDLHGGWCDASGDVSKYFSHLAYANFMSPQQIPLVTWSMVNTSEALPQSLMEAGVKDSLDNEALYGADYLLRSLSKDDYFYMIVFSYFDKNPDARRVVGLLANSVTTNQYQCAFREGGGMAIAALARISQWKRNGEYTSAQYLEGAKRAFDHLLLNNTKYDDDGKENIIDDYCALLAAVELWKATKEPLYRSEARKRAMNLVRRMSPKGYFIADDSNRPFWHAADAGLPVIALCRYLQQEEDTKYRAAVKIVIKKALDYNLQVTDEVDNPFGYARQTFKYHNIIQSGFFIPHENETGWWWQGENARLGSLAAATLVGGRIVYPDETNPWHVKPALAAYAAKQLSWILGGNPYDICFLYGFGKNNVPYMSSNFGHGSQKGGISNGITGGDGHPTGDGIDFKTEAAGNEWRWTEQWLPHAAWFLQAVTAISQNK